MENQPKRETIHVAIPTEQPAGRESMSRSSSIRDVRPGLKDDEVSFKIPTNEDAAVHVHDKHGEHSWQAKILRVIHAKWFQYFMIILLLLDIIILFTELFLMSMVSSCFCCCVS